MSFSNVLFLCVANSARSQMAEALARMRFGHQVCVQSAGSVPTRVNPWAIKAMAEVGYDLAAHSSKSVDNIDLAAVDLVITLCAEEECPIALSNAAHRLAWPLPDPDCPDEPLSDEQRLTRFRVVREAIDQRLAKLQASHGEARASR